MLHRENPKTGVHEKLTFNLPREYVWVWFVEDARADKAVQLPDNKKKLEYECIFQVVRFHLLSRDGLCLEALCIGFEECVCRPDERRDQIGSLLLIKIPDEIHYDQMEVIVPIEDILEEDGLDEQK